MELDLLYRSPLLTISYAKSADFMIYFDKTTERSYNCPTSPQKGIIWTKSGY